MSFWEILNTVLLKPLELIFEVVYMMAYKVIGNPGFSIIVLSLFMNFLVLPLYRRADAIQEQQHALEKRLQKGVDHIKKTFRGDERMMLLQTYYRQNHYKPVYVLRSAVSLLLQIPFFIAAYRFLSNLSLLKGVPFGPIVDLGSPDGLLQIGGAGFHVLPVIMTAVNLISCIIFTKGSPLKSKIQLYAMALFFLVFLYNSPAGLVFYWTLNNVFSLGKTIFYKLKDPGKILSAVFSAGGIAMAVYGIFLHRPSTLRKLVFIVGIAVLLQAPLVGRLFGNRRQKNGVRQEANKKLFFTGALFLAILSGALIPSAVIKASPQEFVKLTDFYDPLWYVVSSFCLALGIFVIWAGVFYFLAKPAMRVYFDKGIWILSGIAIVNYMFFGKDLGLISAELTYENIPEFLWTDQLKNFIVMMAVIVVFCVLYRFKEKAVADALSIGVLAVFCMSSVNLAEVGTEVKEMKERDLEQYTKIPELTLSRTGKNVIVLMLDRAVSEYTPYLFQEKPELEAQFAGFTYYANTLSFGSRTNFGAPAVFGGYEYTPVEMNKRDDEWLVDKHNEALKMMPVLFDQNGYQVTVCDPPLAGYETLPDLSIYEEYPDIHSYVLEGKFTEDFYNRQAISNRHRNFFCFGIMKTAPLSLQKTIYDYGNYNQAPVADTVAAKQIQSGLYHAVGVDEPFMNSYNVLSELPNITETTDEDMDVFLMMSNETTHEPMMLQEPDYVPAPVVDNESYENSRKDRYTFQGKTLSMANNVQMTTYQVHMATLIQLGKWFDYMREEGVYDNTRIILVSDHGRSELSESDEHRLGENEDFIRYYPLLMVKDFDCREYETSEEFMTNGDVPALAMEGLIEDAVNPFTGNSINSEEKTAHDQYVIASDEFIVEKNNGMTYLPSLWYAVREDMRDADNWRLLSEEATVLPPEEE